MAKEENLLVSKEQFPTMGEVALMHGAQQEGPSSMFGPLGLVIQVMISGLFAKMGQGFMNTMKLGPGGQDMDMAQTLGNMFGIDNSYAGLAPMNTPMNPEARAPIPPGLTGPPPGVG